MKVAPLLGLTAVLLSAAWPAKASFVEIGTAEEVRMAAYGTLPGESQKRIFRNDEVFADQRIKTVTKGGLRIEFLDETELWVGESSELVLDQFVYDPDRGTGELVTELGTGLFRFVTGGMNHDAYRILTPAAVIGVRGTDFSVSVGHNGLTAVSVHSGSVSVSPRGGGSPTSVSAGQTASISTGDGTVSVTSSGPLSEPPASVSPSTGGTGSSGPSMPDSDSDHGGSG